MSHLGLLHHWNSELEREIAESYFNDFGFGLTPQYIQRYSPNMLCGRSSLPFGRRFNDHHGRDRNRYHKKDEGLVCPIGKNGFQVSMDVAHFKPNELQVKVIDDDVVVEGKHEEREDNHGLIQRHFVRRYTLPKGYDANKIESTLSSDGVLTVSVPKPQSQKTTNERIIQIQHTGPAHLHIKDNTDEKKAEEQGEASAEKTNNL